MTGSWQDQCKLYFKFLHQDEGSSINSGVTLFFFLLGQGHFLNPGSKGDCFYLGKTCAADHALCLQQTVNVAHNCPGGGWQGKQWPTLGNLLLLIKPSIRFHHLIYHKTSLSEQLITKQNCNFFWHLELRCSCDFYKFVNVSLKKIIAFLLIMHNSSRRWNINLLINWNFYLPGTTVLCLNFSKNVK